MSRLTATCGLLVGEACMHALFAGTRTGPRVWEIVVPALLALAPAAYKAAEACFELLTQGAEATD
jgi:hypothetical protein